MSAWIHHHTHAGCTACDWLAAHHGPDAVKAGRVVRKARDHYRTTGHYVQVERGAHMHIAAATTLRTPGKADS